MHNYISLNPFHVAVVVHPVRINCSALCLLGVLYCNLCKYFIYEYWHAWIVLPSMSGSAEEVVDRSGAQEYLLVIPVCPLPDRPLGHNAAWWCHLSPSVACSYNDPPSTSRERFSRPGTSSMGSGVQVSEMVLPIWDMWRRWMGFV